MREWLKNEREQKKISQKEMAEKIGISESYYSLIENGSRQKRMDITLVSKIATVIGISVGKICEYESESI